LFSDATVSQTFALVDKVAFPDMFTALTRGLLYPLLTAVTYIFVYPYPARFVYAFTLRRQREVNAIKQAIADETPLTLEESRRLRSEYVEHERMSDERVQKLHEEIARLKAALDSAATPEPKLEPLAQPNLGKLLSRSPIELEPTQVFLLKIIEKVGGPATVSELLKKSMQPKVKTEFDIGELEKRKLLRRGFNGRLREETLEFTHEGRRALLEISNSEANLTTKSTT
jgi:hypothetical protein